MCGGPERIRPSPSSLSSPTPSSQEEQHQHAPGLGMNHLTVETDDFSSSLLELAANDDVDALRQSLDRDPSAINEAGLWYSRRKGSNQMVLEHRTPLMVAATYGSLSVLKLIVSLPSVDVNRVSGPGNATALHCAASGGSSDAVDAVKILLAAGADPTLVDANGNRAADVIAVPPRLPDVKNVIGQLLGRCSDISGGGFDRHHPPLSVTTSSSNSTSPPRSLSPDEEGSPSARSTSSPPTAKYPDLTVTVSERKEYPVDPTLPDIKNSIYATDEFRMFSFKIRPCSRAYSHDWTECPFAHPGENARRRDPRKYHYSCVPCPDFRKGSCRRGDMCEYAHGVFESWLHPAQYRTRICKDGTSCARRVCFFAHTDDELRPLYMSTGSAVSSPRASTASVEMAAALGFMPGSPSSVSAGMSAFTPPMSPLANGIGHSSLAWPQPNVPMLNLPVSNLQASRLRSSLSAREMPVDDQLVMSEFDKQQLFNDWCQSRLSSSTANHSVRTKAMNPSNLDDLFSAEITSSPRYNSDQGCIFSPSHKTAILNHFQQQQNLLSPINTGVPMVKATDAQQLPVHSSLLQASLNISSPGFMSPRSMEPVSPLSSRLAVLSQRERQQQTLRSLSSRDFGPISSPILDSPTNLSWSKWASPSGIPDWGVNGEELGLLRRSSSFELRGTGDEPDLSWVHSLVRDTPPEKMVSAAVAPAGHSELPAIGVESSNSKGEMDGHDQAVVLGAWLDNMQLDQIIT
ncbi:zinc finger CCCH domain-containing protein 24 [Musa acuminata AAA Group]|uniref:zinc finger CCCH domain-containing protein 24 n=1 Tax=Musa acuminata AAA Group TaxID=214697 RepID=UPI0031E13CB5